MAKQKRLPFSLHLTRMSGMNGSNEQSKFSAAAIHSYYTFLLKCCFSPRDWCLSRQLWWGHQIPMFRVQGTYEETDIDQGGVVLKDNLGQFWVFGTNEEEALANARTVLKTEEIRVTRVCVFLLPFDVTLYPL